MKRFIATLLTIPALALLTGLAGCGKEDPPAKRKPIAIGSDGSGGGDAKKATIKPGTAKVVGRVVFDGEPPTPASLEKVMGEHPDKATCLAGDKMDQTWVVGKDRGVANAVIWISPPEGSEFEVVKATDVAVIDQPNCVYIPHVLVIKPGQKLEVKNSANVLHDTNLDLDSFANPKPFKGTINPKDSRVVELNPQDTVITVGCNFHRWMQAKIWAMPHQYVAKTDADGKFVIDNVLEGSELSVVAWHEGASPNFFYGAGKKGTKHTFKAGENQLGDLKVK